jgi:hypothetical protein
MLIIDCSKTEKKMASKGRQFSRLPWQKLCSESDRYIHPGSLPHGFQLKDPELLRVEQIAELWKHIHQRQQSGRLHALHFTDEVFKFDRSPRGDVGQVLQAGEDEAESAMEDAASIPSSATGKGNAIARCDHAHDP